MPYFFYFGVTRGTNGQSQLSIMIIYNSTRSILIQWIRVMWQSDLVITKESVLPVCDEPYHTNKRKVQKVEELKVVWDFALAIETTVVMA